MPNKAKPHAATSHTAASSPFSLLSGWVRQGTESFFATQRVLLDLVMRQNANTLHAIRERLTAAREVPRTVLTDIAGEGLSNFVAAQRVLLHLAERQNEIVMTGVKERTGGYVPLAAMTDLVRRSLDTFIDMQQHFLSIAAKQTDVRLWPRQPRPHQPAQGLLESLDGGSLRGGRLSRRRQGRPPWAAGRQHGQAYCPGGCRQVHRPRADHGGPRLVGRVQSPVQPRGLQ